MEICIGTHTMAMVKAIAQETQAGTPTPATRLATDGRASHSSFQAAVSSLVYNNIAICCSTNKRGMVKAIARETQAGAQTPVIRLAMDGKASVFCSAGLTIPEVLVRSFIT